MKDNKKKFRLFDSQREGRGVEKTDLYTGTDLKGFFIKYRLHFTQLLYVNLLMVFGNFPVLFLAIAMSSLTRTVYLTPAAESFPVLRALFLQSAEVPASTLVTVGLEGIQVEANAMTPWTYVMFGLGALVLLTFGVVNAGTTYLLRNMIKGEPVFVVSDFLHAVRTNWRQALPFGILDGILLVLIPFDLVFLFTSMNSVMSGIIFGITLALAIIYFFMRFYIYLQMVTFDLSIRQILKNSLIFTMLGLKRNVMAALGIALTVAVNFMLFFAFGGLLASVAILLPLVLLFASGAFMAAYAAYPKMMEFMVSEETPAGTRGGYNEEDEEGATAED